MGFMQDHFPVFEANQVLTSAHLNDVFSYLDQQERLTRSNLIGIGIACGLEIKLDSSNGTIHLSKGCGVTSEGYLIAEPDDVALVAYRANYLIPTDPDYAPFNDTTKMQYPLWELFPAGEPNTTSLATPAGFLDDKAVLLFLELKRQGLRNCSPNNCDDKGAEVMASVKPLLIRRADLDTIIAAAKALGGGLASGDLESALLEKLKLPDLHLLRFDVPNSNPATSNDVFGGFLNVFHAGKLAASTGQALTAAYAAFKPLLQATYPANPFAGFKTAFGFLDETPTTADQVRFVQYYVDLFDDLLGGYDEFRWAGAELICVCCPPEALFPRHLMLGLSHPEKVSQPGIYRQDFLASFAGSDCAGRTKALLQLFDRLVEMTKRFTGAPSLPKADSKAAIDPQIRITPSTLGDKPLSGKAIPYYYHQNGTPPLYRLWNAEKTRRNRANQNLSYRYDEYSPAAPAFVAEPLRYDLEPYDFLRIEGHLGKNYQHVLKALLLLKSRYRLPIEVIALRSGAYDDTQPVDLSKETARFQDLEALYDALREELLSSLAEGVMYLYDIAVADSNLPGGKPQLSLLKAHAPNYRYPANSVGAWYENYLKLFESRPYIDVNQNQIDSNAVLTVYCTLFNGTTGLPNANFAHAVSIYYFSKLAEIMPSALDALAYADFENKYQDLLGLVRFFRSDAIANISSDLHTFIPQEDLIDRFDEVLFSCKLDPVRSIHDEYLKRIRELKKKQFLSDFLQQHPGIQHKAGVPLGGTFIIVYHDDTSPPAGGLDIVGKKTAILTEARSDSRARTRDQPIGPEIGNTVGARTTPAMDASVSLGLKSDAAADVNKMALTDAINRISSNFILASNPDIGLLLGSLAGQLPIFDVGPPVHGLTEQVTKIISTAVNELTDGTVIADFFLPYRISYDYPAVQFVLPTTAPTFTTEVGCATSDGMAAVTVKATGGTAPYEVKVDDEGYQALGNVLALKVGAHTLTIRDVDGAVSPSQSITIASPLVLGDPTFRCTDDFSSYRAIVSISGGTPPYTVNGKTITGATYTTDLIASGATVALEVIDSNQCASKLDVAHTCVCDLPCAGIALRRGYRFWLPEPGANKPYKSFKLEKLAFTFEFPQGGSVDLSADVQAIVQAATPVALSRSFTTVVGKWLDAANELIAKKTGKKSWLALGYESAQPGTLGTLWIEYFECLKFDLEVVSTFQRPETIERLNLGYSPEGTTIQGVGEAAGETVKIPAFDGTKTDKCHPQNPVETLCAKAPNLKLKITKQLNGLTASLKVTASGADKPVAYLWEIQDARPAMANGASIKITFTSRTPSSKLFSVTAFTKGGCRVVAADKIDLG